MRDHRLPWISSCSFRCEYASSSHFNVIPILLLGVPGKTFEIKAMCSCEKHLCKRVLLLENEQEGGTSPVVRFDEETKEDLLYLTTD